MAYSLQWVSWIFFALRVNATFHSSTRKIRPGSSVGHIQPGVTFSIFGSVEFQVAVVIMQESCVRACVPVCVQCPGLCLCLTNPSYTCCSYAGLSQPTAHWIVSWMNAFSHSLCFWHSRFLSVCLSLFLPLSLSCIPCISVQELTLT